MFVRLVYASIIGLILAGVLIAAWGAGYRKASSDLAKNFYEGPEGYCLADKPPHPGQCNA